MSKRILINGITLEGANIVPLLLKVREWQSTGSEVTFLGSADLEQQILSIGIITGYRFINLNNCKKWKNKIRFILEAFKRNLLAVFLLKDLIGKFDVVYTISPVLDLILLPYLLKKTDKHLKWVTVFDNSVPLIVDNRFVAGNKVIRLLSWIFYKISLFLLRSADYIFVIKPELQAYMLKNGFSGSRLVITGNGVEKNFIINAQVRKDYNIDALFIGRINEAKGIFDLLKVLIRVKEKYPNFQLAIMGRGDEIIETKFKRNIKDFGLEKNVQFLGYKIGQEKFDIIRSSKIFLFLSETESVPIAPLEAVCSGLKTIVYDLDAYNMYHNEEVIIFKKNDYVSVADRVLEIFDNKDFDNEKGKLLLDNYSWDKIAKIEYNKMIILSH